MEPKKQDEDDHDGEASPQVFLSNDDKDEEVNVHVEQPEDDGQIGRWAAVAMMINLYVGSFVVSIPSAVATGGYVGIFLIFFMGCVAGSTALLIAKGFAATKSRAYDEYGYKAAGTKAKYSVRVVISAMFLLVIILLSWYTYEAARRVITMMSPNEDATVIAILWPTLFSLFLIVLTSLKPKTLVYLGILATSLVLILVIGLVVSFVLVIHQEETGSLDGYDDERVWIREHSMVGVLAGVAANFGGHGGTPNIYRRMKDPERDFPFVVAISFGFMTLTYCGLGILGYYALGDDVSAAEDVILYLSHVVVGGGPFITFLGFVFALKLMTSQPVYVEAALEWIEPGLLKHIQGCAINTFQNRAQSLGQVTLRMLVFLLLSGVSIALFLGGTNEMQVPANAFLGILIMFETYLFPVIFTILLVWAGKATLSSKAEPEQVAASPEKGDANGFSTQLSGTTTLTDANSLALSGSMDEATAEGPPYIWPEDVTPWVWAKHSLLFIICSAMLVLSVYYFIDSLVT